MRVLRVLTRPNVGGPMRQALALWPQDQAVGLQTLVAVGACAPLETEMDCRSIPEVSGDRVTPASHGLVRLRRLGRSTRPWRDLGAVRELRQLIAAFRPDVVHTHTSQAGFFGRRAAWSEGVATIAHTFHGHVLSDYYPAPVSALFRHLEARQARRTNWLYAVSPSCRDELHRMGIGAGRIEVVPPALDLAPFCSARCEVARKELGLGPEDFALGFVGRLVEIKQPAVFVDLVRRMPGVRGFVFGGGPLAGQVEGQERVSALGAIDSVHRLLPGLDALVLCSRREGCPLVAIEAFAAGVPVVGLDVPGVRDALADWGAGILVPATEGSAGLALAVEGLRRDPLAAERLVEAGRHGLGRFAAASVAARLAADYRRAGLAASG